MKPEGSSAVGLTIQKDWYYFKECAVGLMRPCELTAERDHTWNGF